ncbi:MAG: polymerase [Treponema sp.]|nr:polymerase [Treponema sp.]
MYRLIALFLSLFIAANTFADIKSGITGAVEWDTSQLKADVSLDLASAGIRLPSGRTQGESLLNLEYLRLIQSGILNLQVDSSSTIGDLIQKGDFSMSEAEALALTASSLPPSLSSDLKKILSSYKISLSAVSALLLKHNNPSAVMRTLSPVSTAQYTGLIIIASESLPVHGRRSSALAVPCLFPKIWDSDMNLIYERNMLESRSAAMARYASLESIFQNNPSGLSAELTSVVGEKPLRVFARGVFGVKPTDLIIDKNDALLIISSQENRRLLSEGRVAIILDDSVLKQKFSAE